MGGQQAIRRAEVSKLVERLRGGESGLPDQKSAPEVLATGVQALDQLIVGFPRGAISELIGPDSSGRTTLVNQLLRAATFNEEVCAYVDLEDSFDPRSADSAGVRLGQLLWVRCGGRVEHALKVLDLILHGGGFGVVVLDMGWKKRDHRIPFSYWYRFRQPIEHTPTMLVILTRKSLAMSSASLKVEMDAGRPNWEGTGPHSRLLRGVTFEARLRKPFRHGNARIEGRALQLRR